MKTHRTILSLGTLLLLLLTVFACGSAAPTEALPILTNTPRPKPTHTARPTATRRPTSTPDKAATQKADELAALLDAFAEEGYIESTKGKITELEPFEQEWAQLNWYRWWTYLEIDSDFLFKAHFDWSTASATPAESGCGVLFGLQDNGDHYLVFLGQTRIQFLMRRGEWAYQVGKTRGPGVADFGNPASTDFALAVKGQSAYVLVNDEFTEYTLSKDQTTRGYFGYSVYSGTNRDYGTRCKISDSVLWTPR